VASGASRAQRVQQTSAMLKCAGTDQRKPACKVAQSSIVRMALLLDGARVTRRFPA